MENSPIQAALQAALPAAIEAAIKADPLKFVELGLEAEGQRFATYAHVEMETIRSKAGKLIHTPKALAFAAVLVAAVFTGIGLLIAHLV